MTEKEMFLIYFSRFFIKKVIPLFGRPKKIGRERGVDALVLSSVPEINIAN